MGRFDGPHFQVEGEDVVSVWVAIKPTTEMPLGYFDENYSDDDEEPFTRFSADFGFGFYDHDFAESTDTGDGSQVPVGELLRKVSYGLTFCEAVASRAEAFGVDQTAFVFLMYNFRYDPAVTGIRESEFLRFLGVFHFDRHA